MARPPDHHDALMSILQKAEMKAKMSLYYLQQDLKQDKRIDSSLLLNSSLDGTKIDERIAQLEQQISLLEKENKTAKERGDENSEMLKSSQIYCRGLENKMKATEKSLKAQQSLVSEKVRHNEAMEEEIEELMRKIEKYPKKIQELRNEADKFRNKVTMLEEQKKIMESQSAQNEQQVQLSHGIRQDLQQANRYIDRLKCYLNKTNELSQANAPVLEHNSATQTEDNEGMTHNVTKDTYLKDYSVPVLSSESHSNNQACAQYKIAIDQARLDLSLLRKDALQLTQFSSDLDNIKDLIGKLHNTPESSGCYDNLPFSHLPTEFLLETERVEVVCRILSPVTGEHNAVWSCGDSTKGVLLRTNAVQQYTCDMVIPMNAPYKQLIRNAIISTSLAVQGRSTLMLMFGNASSTLYGSPDQPGLISRIISELLKVKRDDMILSASIGTFHGNQMCDALVGVDGDISDDKMTALTITSHEQAAELLSKANISDDADYVLNQFSLRHAKTNISSVSLLECAECGPDTAVALYQYRMSGKTPPFTQSNVLSDTLQAYLNKGASIIVYINISPETVHISQSQKHLDTVAKITGIAPIKTTKRKSRFSFR